MATARRLWIVRWIKRVRESRPMPTPFESALLNLQLFELRREAVLRQARQWFLMEFNPESFAELVEVVSGERNAWFRMVIGYWDMAASLVTTGAIDGDAWVCSREVLVELLNHRVLADIGVVVPGDERLRLRGAGEAESQRCRCEAGGPRPHAMDE